MRLGIPRETALRCAWLLTLLLIAAGAMISFGPSCWACDLLSHFPAQLAAAALITSLAFAVIGRLRFIVIPAAVAAWNLGAAAFQAFLHDTGLRDTRRGRGVQPTWPAWLPLAQVPIDHALVSAGVRVHARFVGGRVGRVGSDRLPIVLDFPLDLP